MSADLISSKTILIPGCNHTHRNIISGQDELCDLPAEFVVSNPYVEGDIPFRVCKSHLRKAILFKVTSLANANSAFDAGRVQITVLFCEISDD